MVLYPKKDFYFLKKQRDFYNKLCGVTDAKGFSPPFPYNRFICPAILMRRIKKWQALNNMQVVGQIGRMRFG